VLQEIKTVDNATTVKSVNEAISGDADIAFSALQVDVQAAIADSRSVTKCINSTDFASTKHTENNTRQNSRNINTASN
jgi:FlaG/FlaF family flagellin (archaellin)